MMPDRVDELRDRGIIVPDAGVPSYEYTIPGDMAGAGGYLITPPGETVSAQLSYAAGNSVAAVGDALRSVAQPIVAAGSGVLSFVQWLPWIVGAVALGYLAFGVAKVTGR